MTYIDYEKKENIGTHHTCVNSQVFVKLFCTVRGHKENNEIAIEINNYFVDLSLYLHTSNKLKVVNIEKHRRKIVRSELSVLILQEDLLDINEFLNKLNDFLLTHNSRLIDVEMSNNSFTFLVQLKKYAEPIKIQLVFNVKVSDTTIKYIINNLISNNEVSSIESE